MEKKGESDNDSGTGEIPQVVPESTELDSHCQVTGFPVIPLAPPSQNGSMMLVNGPPRYKPLCNTPPFAPGGSQSLDGSQVTGFPMIVPAQPSQNGSMMLMNGPPRYEPVCNTPPFPHGGSHSLDGSQNEKTFFRPWSSSIMGNGNGTQSKEDEKTSEGNLSPETHAEAGPPFTQLAEDEAGPSGQVEATPPLSQLAEDEAGPSGQVEAMPPLSQLRKDEAGPSGQHSLHALDSDDDEFPVFALIKRKKVNYIDDSSDEELSPKTKCCQNKYFDKSLNRRAEVRKMLSLAAREGRKPKPGTLPPPQKSECEEIIEISSESSSSSSELESLPDVPVKSESPIQEECCIGFEELQPDVEILIILPCRCAAACLEHGTQWVANNNRCYRCNGRVENVDFILCRYLPLYR